MSPALRLTATLAALALCLAACGISDPYTKTSSRTRSVAATGIRPDEHDGPSAPSPESAPAAAGSTPQSALRSFATLYVNWTAATLPANERRLASMSTGQARAQALAQSAKRSQALSTYAVSNTGEVVAIAAGHGSELGRWAVVTDEQTTGDGPYQGLPATSHVTWATLTRIGAEWVVSGWYPGS